MKCPVCGCGDWRSVEKDSTGVNMKVQCLKCNTVYPTPWNPDPNASTQVTIQ